MQVTKPCPPPSRDQRDHRDCRDHPQRESKWLRRSHAPRNRLGGRHLQGGKHKGNRYWLSLVGLAVLAGVSLGTTHAAPGDNNARPATPPRETASLITYHSSTTLRQRAISRDAERERLGALNRRSLTAATTRLAAARARNLKALRDQAAARSEELRQRTRWTLPVGSYRLTGRFGESSSLWSSTHTGLDFAAPDGTAIRSVAAGIVQEAGWAGPYGNRTIVQLSDGTEIWYCHQSRLDVTTGQRVTSGQRIGTVGSTGNVTGAHLHLEVRPGGADPIDPYTALTSRGLNP